ncbi:hypothetical protein HNQ80_002500 [Anaerosolibacter carboniphilus]|uniref:DUF1659 domain-containing protein n=1 Tax=Anaerosolibacter carboniphilus TaxID=1417629 RepID=A0A841KWK9_9FIRM|nr:DUF1659 domain-containing protein [Anaerosolibacter carboniphilus]MBB6216400.1 hypothetical protein [Anaerosolibacter carboniphilus]
MPVNVTLGASRLKISYSVGLDDNGKEKLKTKTYTNIKPTALDDDVYAVASALVGLQSNPVVSVGRVDEKKITQA